MCEGAVCLRLVVLEPEMVKMGDAGRLSGLADKPDLEINKAYEQILKKIIDA